MAWVVLPNRGNKRVGWQLVTNDFLLGLGLLVGLTAKAANYTKFSGVVVLLCRRFQGFLGGIVDFYKG